MPQKLITMKTNHFRVSDFNFSVSDVKLGRYSGIVSDIILFVELASINVLVVIGRHFLLSLIFRLQKGIY